MPDTLGGGLQVLGAIQSLRKRLEKSDAVVVNELPEVVEFAKRIMADPLANTKERLEAAKLLQRVAEQGDGIATKLADFERVDAGKHTSQEKVVVRIVFDDAG